MIKHIQSVFVGVLWVTFILYFLARAYLSTVSKGRSLWWLALELVLLAAAFACLFLLERRLPRPDLEAIRGVRAVAVVTVVVVTLIPAVVAGTYLDGLIGFELSFGALLASTAVLVTMRLVAARLSRDASPASASTQVAPFSGPPSESTPPN